MEVFFHLSSQSFYGKLDIVINVEWGFIISPVIISTEDGLLKTNTVVLRKNVRPITDDKVTVAAIVSAMILSHLIKGHA